MNRLVERIGVKGIWVVDRGYDSGLDKIFPAVESLETGAVAEKNSK